MLALARGVGAWADRRVCRISWRRLPHRLWRRIHLGAFPLLVVSTIHLLAAGSDRATTPVALMLATAAAATTFLVLFRLLLAPVPTRRAPRPRSSGKVRPPPKCMDPTGWPGIP